eukprot:6127926-Prorocentrum_lima.AAC.1
MCAGQRATNPNWALQMWNCIPTKEVERNYWVGVLLLSGLKCSGRRVEGQKDPTPKEPCHN